MVKRAAEDSSSSASAIKKPRLSPDRISKLSDELLLKAFSTLSVQDLNICQRVSHRFQELAGDSQLWKAAYYERFVRPRVLRLPGWKRQSLEPSTFSHSSKLSRWLDDGHLVKRGNSTNWKRQYKLRHNWSRGSCDVNNITVSASAPTPPLLAKLQDGIVYSVDSTSGLRAWAYKDEQRLLASISLRSTKDNKPMLPTSFALDAPVPETDGEQQRLVIGFDNGAFSIYSYAKRTTTFSHSYTHPPSSIGMITAIVITSPYVLSMSDRQILSLYRLGEVLAGTLSDTVMEPPRLLTSLKSHTVWPPLSLSLRKTPFEIVASIAYCIPTFHSGWTTGVQEVHITTDGEIIKSRLASAVAQGFIPLASSPLPAPLSHPPQSRGTPLDQSRLRPTSLSYSHPYLLVSHSDNTLTLYLVNSTATDLSVSAGKRLWGHTSSVFGAHVGGRGKAISVSTRGNEIRIWELEGTTISATGRSRSTAENNSVQVTPEKRPPTLARVADVTEAIARRGNGLGLALTGDPEDWAVTRGWVGFDDENVVLLREQKHGGQALTVYDFT